HFCATARIGRFCGNACGGQGLCWQRAFRLESTKASKGQSHESICHCRNQPCNFGGGLCPDRHRRCACRRCSDPRADPCANHRGPSCRRGREFGQRGRKIGRRCS